MDGVIYGLEEVTEAKLLLILVLGKKKNPIYLDETVERKKHRIC